MSKGPVVILVFLVGVGLLSIFYSEAEGCGDNICEAGENSLFCPQDCKAQPRGLKAIGEFTDVMEETSTHRVYLFNMLFRWNDSVYIRHLDGVNVKVGIPKNSSIGAGKIYDISSRGSVPDVKVPYYADVIEGYDEIVYNYHGFYDPCWDYDCRSKVPPWKRITPPAKLFLSEVEGAEDTYTKGSTIRRPILPREDISIAFVFVYDESPVPNENISTMKDEFAYVPAWYKEKADELFGNGDIINMSITFFDEQLKLPPDLQPQNYSRCDFSDFIGGQLPEVKDYDILVQFYYAGAIDTRCLPRPINRGGSGYDSIFLFTKPEFISAFHLESLTRSFAHELAHVFGATDTYTGEAEISAGYKECCWINTEAPDETSDIMCHRVRRYNPFGCYNPPLQELVMTEATAKEIGWWDIDGDGYIEVNDPCPLDKNNECVIR